jgi:ABC-type lipoprotein export system ATPase subunit
MIHLKDVEKSHKTRAGFTYVLRQVNLRIEAGEFITIMGPSGAGKSTLLNIMGLFDSDFEGEYHFDEIAVQSMKPKDRAALNKSKVGFVFQQFHLLDDLTVSENLDMPLSYRDVARAERQAMVADVLDRFGIVAIARAIISKPSVIFADEPTGNLHTDQGREIMDLFKKLNDEGTTVIQVTHNEAWAQYGNRIVQLHDGWVQ